MRGAVVLACLLGPAVVAAWAGEAPGPIGLKGAPGVVTPPAGAWEQRNDSVAPGQWYVEYKARNGAALMRAHVFPVKSATEPDKVLVQAVDVFFRGLGVHGFGVPSTRVLDVWGCPAARGSIMAVVGGARVTGRARIVRLSKHQWGFAIGYAQSTASTQVRNALHGFVASLEPAAPVFYERRFHTPKAYERLVVRVPGDEPLTAGEVAAVERALEAGIGSRFPLALMPPIREALLADARKGTARTREGYRATARALKSFDRFEPDQRREALRTLGKRILDAILKRANVGYEPAMQFAKAWYEFRSLRIGTVEDGLTAGDLANRIEMSEFLASIAADRGVRAEGKVRDDLVLGANARWKDIPAAEREGWRAAGALWSALRYAWDHAKPEGRFAFRRAVAGRLHPGEAASFAGLADERALKRYLKGLVRGEDATEMGVMLLRAAFRLSLADRRALIDTLGVKDAYGFHLGW